MNGRVIVLALLLVIAAPLTSHAEAAGVLEDRTAVERALADGGGNAETEQGRLGKTAVAAATGAAIGSIWPGPGTVLGFVVGGIYGFLTSR